MEFPLVTAPVSIDDLFVAYSMFGVPGLIELGYFHALAGDAGSARKFTVTVPVVGASNANYVRGTLSYSSSALTEAPLLIASVSGVSANHAGSVDLFNVTATSCDFIARQSPVDGSATLPLNGTLTVVALK